MHDFPQSKFYRMANWVNKRTSLTPGCSGPGGGISDCAGHVPAFPLAEMSEHSTLHSTKKPGVWLPAFRISRLAHAELLLAEKLDHEAGTAWTRTKNFGAVSGMVALSVTWTVCTSPTVPVTVCVAVASTGQVARSVEVCTE